GEIKLRSRRHRRQSALLVTQERARVMIDCGTDWLKALASVSPTAIVITHAHPDHAFGLAHGASCPVYATEETWVLIDRYPVCNRYIVQPREIFQIGGVSFEAFPVDHSLGAPAVGYRVTGDDAAFFYVPDLVAIRGRRAALQGVALYVGDGATIKRSMIRRGDHALIGHSPIAAQLGWCEREGVGRAIFTHCGSEIVRGDARVVAARVRTLGAEHGVDARVAHDGLMLSLQG
ncbi:MAG: MBL fold metallo-hydrolase, partial [Methyloceanibacter sp.]